MLVSIIIPCYQNESQLPQTVEEIFTSTDQLAEGFELILIDDGSIDGTWKTIQKLSQKFDAIGAIKLKKNIGAYNALLAGFEYAKGEAFLVIAADGDDPPKLIPDMIKAFRGVDAVLANRASSEKTASNRTVSSLFYRTLRMAGAKNIPEGGSDFLIMKRAIYERCKADGFRSGNTLIQLVQFAESIKTIPYRKGKSKPTSWSFAAKLRLLFQTLNQFIWLPFVAKNPIPFEVEQVDRSLRSFDN